MIRVTSNLLDQVFYIRPDYINTVELDDGSVWPSIARVNTEKLGSVLRCGQDQEVIYIVAELPGTIINRITWWERSKYDTEGP